MRTLRFVRHHAPFNPGDLAGFPPAEADRLIAKGVAQPVETEARAKSAKPPKPED